MNGSTCDYNPAAERAVLGACLLGNTTTVDDCRAMFGSDDVFFDPNHARIWSVIAAVREEGGVPDPITIGRRLPYDCVLLSELVHEAPLTFNPQHPRIVLDCAVNRETVKAITRAEQRMEKTPEKRDEIITDLEADLQRINRTARQRSYDPPRIIDWLNLLTGERTEPDWLPGKLLACGEQIGLIGDGKVGKSMLVQEFCWHAVMGTAFLGDAAREPLRVMYVDHENTEDELRDRMISFGATIDQVPILQARLAYLPFPAFGPLDTPEGAARFLAAVDHFNPDVIILDTVSRMIAGRENDSDTWLSLYRLTLLPLKRAKRSVIRLDHFGKDHDKGARGNSAKEQDVNHVWELSGTSKRLVLKRTHTRSGLGPDKLIIKREGKMIGDRWAAGMTRHVVLLDDAPTVEFVGVVTTELAKRFDELGIPRDAGRDRLRQACKTYGITARNDQLAAVVKFRKDQLCH